MAVTVTLLREVTQPLYMRVLKLTGLTADTPEDFAHGGPTDTAPLFVVPRLSVSPTDDSGVSISITPDSDLDNLTLEVNPVSNADATGAVTGAEVEVLCIWATQKDSPQTATASGLTAAVTVGYQT